MCTGLHPVPRESAIVQSRTAGYHRAERPPGGICIREIMGERILAVDYGRRRIGLALSDPTGTLATGLETLEIKSQRQAVERIAAGRTTWEYDRVVVGLPIEASGELGDMAHEVLRFVKELRAACPVPVETVDERFTSAQATRMFHATGRRFKGNKGAIDRLAAELILDQYLQQRRHKKEEWNRRPKTGDLVDE